MSNEGLVTLGSIEAVRPVFLIVMGVFLSLIGWRLAMTSGTWTARSLVAGALLLGFGYTVVMPLYEAKLIEPLSRSGHYRGAAEIAVGWHVVKLTVMNFGWLLFGIGIALHANLLGSPARRTRAHSRTSSAHESIA